MKKTPPVGGVFDARFVYTPASKMGENYLQEKFKAVRAQQAEDAKKLAKKPKPAGKPGAKEQT